MLEKIGLPAKPSVRGGNWVVDASHCQGCSSSFTFINRKHHCRRCGGLFCNNCTLQRMNLRGQGDSPVRVCDPCKKLEDAARFESRYGHKNRAAKGSSKLVPRHEEELISQILGTDGKQPVLSEQELKSSFNSDSQKIANNASSSNLTDESDTPRKEGHTASKLFVSLNGDEMSDNGSQSPEEIRKQAADEKKKYKILKGEGKSDEALQAFKRGKELERQAAALEIAIRKNRRMALKGSTLSSLENLQKIEVSEEPDSKKKKLTSRKGTGEKDELAELRELGWSDADLHDADKKPTKLTLEGELSSLIAEIPFKSSQGRPASGIDRSQVIAHKRQALAFKREGKLAEAKEELKKAKVLEKQIEEQELLGEDEESDDELSALIRSIDGDEQDDLLLNHAEEPGTNFNHLFGVGDDLVTDGNFEVTDDDMNDPDLAAALKSFGWTEEVDEPDVVESGPLDREAVAGKVLELKREALSKKRAGNVSEAMALLKEAKVLEKNLEDTQSEKHTLAPEHAMSTNTQVFGESPFTELENSHTKLPPKSKLVIQKELLAIKKKALALRREGRIEEAEEELKKGKVLESQLEEAENEPKRLAVHKRNLNSAQQHGDDPRTSDAGEDGVDAEVTEQDMRDPALLSVLKNMGWQDEDVEPVTMKSEASQSSADNKSICQTASSPMPKRPRRSKAELQRELLGLKRKALALRRQGKAEEADEELEKAKALESEIAEMELPHQVGSLNGELEVPKADVNLPSVKLDSIPKDEPVLTPEISEIDRKDSLTINRPLSSSINSIPETVGFLSEPMENLGPQVGKSSVESVSTFPQLGQYVDNLEPLSGSKMNDPQSVTAKIGYAEDSNSSTPSSLRHHTGYKSHTSNEDRNVSQRLLSSQRGDKGEASVSTTDRSGIPVPKLDQGNDARKDEILARKRNAVALKREGKLAEAREELRQAKLLEKSLEESMQANVETGSTPVSTAMNSSTMQESRTVQAQKPISSRDRLKLQQESLSHKRNALKLRREGKIEESEKELELAKALESQLEEISPASSSKTEAIDAGVEDLLDPQLMSALKAIGWGVSDMAMQPPKKPESKPNLEKSGNPAIEKVQLEEQIKNEKRRALNLKRAGKHDEAMEALRAAKRLEKKLELLDS